MKINEFIRLLQREFEIVSIVDIGEVVSITFCAGFHTYSKGFKKKKIEQMLIAEIYCIIADISRHIEEIRMASVLDEITSEYKARNVLTNQAIIYNDFMKGLNR